ncbi:MAG: hypothetical protein K2H08_05830 [Duncaniella sp.]|nr:hypothetical protein [Duncaniella sp.]
MDRHENRYEVTAQKNRPTIHELTADNMISTSDVEGCRSMFSHGSKIRNPTSILLMVS